MRVFKAERFYPHCAPQERIPHVLPTIFSFFKGLGPSSLLISPSLPARRTLPIPPRLISPGHNSAGPPVLYRDGALLEKEEPTTAVRRRGGKRRRGRRRGQRRIRWLQGTRRRGRQAGGPAEPLLHRHPEHLGGGQALQERACGGVQALEEAAHVEQLVEGLRPAEEEEEEEG